MRAARTLPPLVRVAFRGRAPCAAHSEGHGRRRLTPRLAGPRPAEPQRLRGSAPGTHPGACPGDTAPCARPTGLAPRPGWGRRERGRLPRHLRLPGLELDRRLPKQGNGETDPAPASRTRLHTASRSVLLAQEPRNGNPAGEARGTPAPSPFTEPGDACRDPELTRTAGSLVAGVASGPEAKPNLSGAGPRRRDGGPQAAAVNGVREGLSGAAWHVLFPLQHRGAQRRGGRAPRKRTGRGRLAAPADGAPGPPAGAPPPLRGATGLSPRTPPSPPARPSLPAGAPAASGPVWKLRKKIFAPLLRSINKISVRK